MLLVIKEFFRVWKWVLVDLPDPRMKDTFLLDSHFYPITILLWYAWLVFKAPDLMKKLPPFKLESIMTVYNVIQVVACSYLSVVSTYYVFHFKVSLRCAAVEYEVNERTEIIIKLMYYYYLLKILDLVDTVFLVMRKKELSFLHCAHHSGMIGTVYAALKYVAGGHTIWVGVLNSYVHSVMYFYYLLCSYNRGYKASIWWKKYITQMQILQFSLVTIIYGQLVFRNPCGYPIWLVFYVVMSALSLTLLFVEFYYTAYIKKKPLKDKSTEGRGSRPPQAPLVCNEY